MTVSQAGNPGRSAFLDQATGLLWPPPAQVRRGRAGHAAAGASELMVLPGLARPRLLVPAGRVAAAAAVRSYGQPGSRRARLATRGIRLAMAGGLGPAVFRDRLTIDVPPGACTIERYLRAKLGRDIRISMYLGPARANRKPVLQLVGPDGAAVGFAKIGVSPLTRQLVRQERDALGRLSAARLTAVTAPTVLHFGQWRDLDVLVLTPLPVWLRRRPLRPAGLIAAVTEVASVGGLTREPLASGGYWRSLTGRLASAPSGAERDALLAELSGLAGQAADTWVSVGAWHGDWAPWNMANTRDGLLVWDWERFTTGVPFGFDVLHYWLQDRVVRGRADPRAAARDCVRRAAALLAPCGVGGPEARLIALAYLAELSTRYLADRQAEAGAPLGAPGGWLIPAIAAEAPR